MDVNVSRDNPSCIIGSHVRRVHVSIFATHTDLYVQPFRRVIYELYRLSVSVSLWGHAWYLANIKRVEQKSTVTFIGHGTQG